MISWAIRVKPFAFLRNADFSVKCTTNGIAGFQIDIYTKMVTVFSEAEWDSEERARYLAEYGRDVESARAHLEHVRRTMKPQ